MTLSVCAAAAMVSLLSCSKETQAPAKAVLVGTPFLTFEAEGPAEQMLTIYADGLWSVDCPDWVTVTPSEGFESTDVIVSVTENVEGGEIDKPREVELTFKGEKHISHAVLKIMQVGNPYRGIDYCSIADMKALPDDALMKLKNVLVVANSSKGVILSDGTTNMYFENKDVKVGDRLEIWGKKAVLNGLPTIAEPCKMEVLSSGNPVTEPVAKDITDGFDDFTSEGAVLVTVDGVFNGTKVSVPGNNLGLTLQDPLSEFDMQQYFAHKVRVTGYYIGKDASDVYLVLTDVVGGEEVSRIIWFSDKFDWLKEYEDAWFEAKGAKGFDSVGHKKSDSAPNLVDPNSSVFAPMGFWADFTERGYADIVGQGNGSEGKNSIYLQSYYLKFGRTDVHNGLRLTAPLLDTYKGQDVTVEFDWCSHCDNGHPADDIQLVIEVIGNGTVKATGTKESAPIYHSQSKTEMEYFWQPVSVTISGMDQSSQILIRPLKYKIKKGEMPHRQRFYLDNINVYSFDMD